MKQPIYANSAKILANPVLARVGNVRLERWLAVGVANKTNSNKKTVISSHYA